MGLNVLNSQMAEAFRTAASRTLTTQALKPRKPWISRHTLDLLEHRRAARDNFDFALEKQMHSLVKASVKQDRSNWLDKLLAEGNWDEVRKLRKGFKPNQGRLRNLQSELVSSEERAETLAEYYEKIQWAVRTIQPPQHSDHLGAKLFVESGPIAEWEVASAGKLLNKKRACGTDGIPPEFWIAITAPGSKACQWAVALCQQCWAEGDVPDDWHEALVVAIFKKGDTSQCENYRPISLLQIGYKLFAVILLQRLKSGGAEDRIWRTQFGFKSRCGTRDALFLARRLIERAWDLKDGMLVFLALDWAKAFDSISPDALLEALRRFGVPACMLKVISSIYSSRRFQVRDAGCTSKPHPRRFGICQGCPLSPFLFVMVMTVLMHDAKRELRAHPAYRSQPAQPIEELLYADDTLLIHSDPAVVKAYMECVRAAGSAYGLSLNWKKLESMSVGCNAEFYSPDGDPIQEKSSFKYLGSMLCNSGKPGTELSSRLGAARKEFDNLCRIWSHATLSKPKKLRIYDACVISKLLYALETVWLDTAGLRKLDAFHHRCLRRIAHVAPSYYSRISNEAVRDMLQANSLKPVLLQRQLKYLGSIASKPAGNVLRDFVFKPGEPVLRPLEGIRRKGRPRASWSKCLYKISSDIAGSTGSLNLLWAGTPASKQMWDRAVATHCFHTS